ncbi:MAG: archaeosine biosynthesis radical SAM protein RaSEA, partial [bacterium]|nr:archaeosine biosynthesis radical SAM protein RaSEA [bacterium]
MINVRMIVKKIVKKLTDVKNFSYYEKVYDAEKKHSISRWVLMIPGSGCEWALDSGGCYMCGFSATIKKIKGKRKKIAQWKIIAAYYLDKFVANPQKEKPEAAAIYNAGSFLNEEEIPPIARNKILQDIAELPSIQNVLVESRPEFIVSETIKEMKAILGNKKLTIAIGLECESDKTRKICVNKGFSKHDYERAVRLLIRLQVHISTYVFLKPLYLNEIEAILEAISTIKYAFEYGTNVVALQSAFVQKETLMHQCYQEGNFRPPWLWSIIEVVKNSFFFGPIHIGSFNDEPMPIAIPCNCGICDQGIIKSFTVFNTTQDPSIFKPLSCHCKEKWEEELEGSREFEPQLEEGV